MYTYFCKCKGVAWLEAHKTAPEHLLVLVTSTGLVVGQTGIVVYVVVNENMKR